MHLLDYFVLMSRENVIFAPKFPQMNDDPSTLIQKRKLTCGVCVNVLSGRAAGYDGVLPSGPDIAQFKQGVKTVAGKMAVLANGVMNTIQVRRQNQKHPFGF